MSETKPVTFARGVPKAERNGLYGMEEYLIANVGETVTAVVTYEIEDAIHSESKDTTYPIVKPIRIEPIRTEEGQKSVLALADAAYRDRTGEGQLDLNFDEAADGGDDE